MDINQNESSHEKNKEVTIIVNTREKVWDKHVISYEEVVALAFDPVEPNVVYTVDYSNGPEPKPEGSLVAGKNTRVQEGMIFDVTPTNKS